MSLMPRQNTKNRVATAGYQTEFRFEKPTEQEMMRTAPTVDRIPKCNVLEERRARETFRPAKSRRGSYVTGL